jgi:hypothetical protein
MNGKRISFLEYIQAYATFLQTARLVVRRIALSKIFRFPQAKIPLERLLAFDGVRPERLELLFIVLVRKLLVLVDDYVHVGLAACGDVEGGSDIHEPELSLAL